MTDDKDGRTTSPRIDIECHYEASSTDHVHIDTEFEGYFVRKFPATFLCEAGVNTDKISKKNDVVEIEISNKNLFANSLNDEEKSQDCQEVTNSQQFIESKSNGNLQETQLEDQQSLVYDTSEKIEQSEKNQKCLQEDQQPSILEKLEDCSQEDQQPVVSDNSEQIQQICENEDGVQDEQPLFLEKSEDCSQEDQQPVVPDNSEQIQQICENEDGVQDEQPLFLEKSEDCAQEDQQPLATDNPKQMEHCRENEDYSQQVESRKDHQHDLGQSNNFVPNELNDDGKKDFSVECSFENQIDISYDPNETHEELAKEELGEPNNLITNESNDEGKEDDHVEYSFEKQIEIPDIPNDTHEDSANVELEKCPEEKYDPKNIEQLEDETECEGAVLDFESINDEESEDLKGVLAYPLSRRNVDRTWKTRIERFDNRRMEGTKFYGYPLARKYFRVPERYDGRRFNKNPFFALKLRQIPGIKGHHQGLGPWGHFLPYRGKDCWLCPSRRFSSTHFKSRSFEVKRGWAMLNMSYSEFRFVSIDDWFGSYRY